MTSRDTKYSHRAVRTRGYSRRESRSNFKQQEKARKAAAQHERQRLAALTPEEIAAEQQEAMALAAKREEESRLRALRQEQERAESIQLLQSEGLRQAGYLASEVASAIAIRTKDTLPEGDWLDDPVAGYQGKPAFAEEYRQGTGVRLLFNLALDCSNSMVNNHVDAASKLAILTLYTALKIVEQSLPPGQLATNVWTWAKSRDGKDVSRITPYDWRRGNLTDEQLVAEEIKSLWMDGEDTYIAPLFQAMHNWELKNNWVDAARLDLIVSDGVLEHPKDVKEADQWQERRDGGVNTVVLNFLPIEDWDTMSVPKRCVEYSATAENVATLLRQVIGEWVLNIV